MWSECAKVHSKAQALRKYFASTRILHCFSCVVLAVAVGCSPSGPGARVDLTQFGVALRRSCRGQRCRDACGRFVVGSALRRRSGAEEVCYVLGAFIRLACLVLPRHGCVAQTREVKIFCRDGFAFVFYFYNTSRKKIPTQMFWRYLKGLCGRAMPDAGTYEDWMWHWRALQCASVKPAPAGRPQSTY